MRMKTLICFNNEGNEIIFWCLSYRNPNLGLATKARACEGAGQEGSPGITFHAPGSARECEGMNPHIPK
jgi:hypothetical protein